MFENLSYGVLNLGSVPLPLKLAMRWDMLSLLNNVLTVVQVLWGWLSFCISCLLQAACKCYRQGTRIPSKSGSFCNCPGLTSSCLISKPKGERSLREVSLGSVKVLNGILCLWFDGRFFKKQNIIVKRPETVYIWQPLTLFFFSLR